MQMRTLAALVGILGAIAVATLLTVAFVTNKPTLLGPACVAFTVAFVGAGALLMHDDQAVAILRKHWAPRDMDSVLRSDPNNRGNERGLKELSLTSSDECTCPRDGDAALRNLPCTCGKRQS